MSVQVDESIFKAYDIRGVVGRTLTVDAVRAIGMALGARGRSQGIARFVVGRDGRLSGPELSRALIEGFTCVGMPVVDVGMVTTPMVYFGTWHLGTGSGVAITGSHNPPDYNGLKMMLGGETLHGEAIKSLARDINGGKLPVAGAPAEVTQLDIWDAYRERVTGDVRVARPMKIAVDCGNGVAGAYAGSLYRAMGCDVRELFCEVDGNFPNHHPDPADPHNLQDLIACLRDTDAEIGLAFDGDGDRLGVVTKDGNIIYPDRQLMLFAQDVLTRVPGGQIIYDVKCSRNVAGWVRKAGGQPLMWRTGHSLVKAKLKETGAPLAGEMSGHVFFSERWYGFDDGLYAGARLLEILSRHADPGAVLNALPDSPSTPELHLQCREGENFSLIESLKSNAVFDGASEIIRIDGLRVEYPDGFGLARPSNTTPVVVMRFEADSDAALARIQADFRREILAVSPSAKLPF